MSTSSLDYITNPAKSVLESLFPESSVRQKRIQELIIELEDMVFSCMFSDKRNVRICAQEASLSVLDFGEYFERLKEVKDFLLDELVSVCTKLRKQDVEVERLTIIVNEKNKAVSTLADENVEDKEELKLTKQKLQESEAKVAELEKREKQYKALVSRFRKTDSAREQAEDFEKHKNDDN